jgi:predicted nucleic acid-binding protein
MRFFVDTDVLLDVVLERKPHFADSSRVLDWAEAHPGAAAVSWHGMANLHYLSKDGAEDIIRELLEFMELPRVGRSQMQEALSMGMPDLEDAMQVTTALAFGAQWIVTRNIRDYVLSPIKAIRPMDFVTLLPHP